MINYEWAPCLDCQNKQSVARTTSSISFRHLRKVSHMSESILNFVSFYIQWNDSQAEFKRQYLLGISMPYGPAFRQLSFIYNKVSGNILDREEWHQNYLIRFGRHRSMSLGKHPLLVRPSIIDPSPSVFGLRSLEFLQLLRASNSLTSLVESPR